MTTTGCFLGRDGQLSGCRWRFPQPETRPKAVPLIALAGRLAQQLMADDVVGKGASRSEGKATRKYP
jgi:hypothetical protein